MPKLLILALLLTACDGASGREEQRLSVFAASSLTDVFGELAAAFAEEEPGAVAVPSFAGSQILRLQIEEGAPADVFASADASHVRALQARSLVEEERVFAENELVVIVPADASELTSFEDLARAERLVIGDAAVPVGRYTRELFSNVSRVRGEAAAAALRSRVVSEESSVRLVRAKVELGEADAAIVYRSDAATSAEVRAIEIPEELRPSVEYHVAVVADSRAPGLARLWLALLSSERGRRILASHGFAPVP